MKTADYIRGIAFACGLDPNQLAELLPVESNPQHVVVSPAAKTQTTRDRLKRELVAAEKAVKAATTPAARKLALLHLPAMESSRVESSGRKNARAA